MKDIKAYIFDLNGTMIDDIPYHIESWFHILNDLGAGLTMERVKQECYGKNHELLERIFPGRFTLEEKDKMTYEKETAYQIAFKPKLKLIDGLHEFLEESKAAGIKMAIASAAIKYNIDFVVDGLNIRPYFGAIVSAEDVATSKPNPETFLKAADQLGVGASECLVFEDTPKGVEGALNAGMQAFVITTLHQEDEFTSYPNVIGFANDFTKIKKAIDMTAHKIAV